MEIGDPRRLLEDNHELILRIAAHAGRRHGLAEDDIEDYKQELLLLLIRNDYRAIRSWRGECSLKTFLHVVAENKIKDYLDKRWGRWRPSVHSKDLGAGAVEYEELVSHRGLMPEEALEELLKDVPSYSQDAERKRLESLVARVPIRPTRREQLHRELSMEMERLAPSRPDEVIAARARLQQVRSALNKAIEQLSSEERLLIKLRFALGEKVSDIARSLGRQPLPLYREYERISKKLREYLVREGLDIEHIRETEGRDFPPDVDKQTTDDSKNG